MTVSLFPWGEISFLTRAATLVTENLSNRYRNIILDAVYETINGLVFLPKFKKTIRSLAFYEIFSYYGYIARVGY